jgi:hypothetical protein
VARGQTLFHDHCARCHAPDVAGPERTHATSPLRGKDDPLWQIEWKSVVEMGTDPNAALNFTRNRVDLSKAGIDGTEVNALYGRELRTQVTRMTMLVAALQAKVDGLKAHGSAADVAAAQEELGDAQDDLKEAQEAVAGLPGLDLHSLSVGQGLTLVGMMVRDRYYRDHHFSPEAQACFAGFDTLDLPQVKGGYKPRPLKGVWATPPFLHNGSVQSLYDLLSPLSERQAARRINVGTRMFDPKHVGYVTARDAQDRPAEATRESGFVLDTQLPGNSNAGHRFEQGFIAFPDSLPTDQRSNGGIIGPPLSPDDRYAIIEYLKVMPDVPDGPATRTPPDCFALLGR